MESSPTTRPPPLRPMNAMNRPMPMPMARRRLTGMASITALRQAAKHQDEDHEAFEHDHGHGHAPVDRTLAEAQRVGHDGVDAHGPRPVPAAGWQ